MVPDMASFRGDSAVTVSDKPVVAAWHFGLVLNITCACVAVCVWRKLWARGGQNVREGERKNIIVLMYLFIYFKCSFSSHCVSETEINLTLICFLM